MYCSVDQESVENSRCFSRNMMVAFRSPSLNSYGTHQPSGPNLRRSCTTLWVKHSANSSVRQVVDSMRSRRSWSTMTV